jgi:peptidoglycan/LPS O-acetylase OafA/YrhL
VSTAVLVPKAPPSGRPFPSGAETHAQAPAHARARIPELDGLRAFAILAVFLHHAVYAPLLWAGVDLFFVLSGFLISGILLRRKDLGQSYFGYFYSRRAKRILAPYTLALVVTSLLFGLAWAKYWYWFAFFATNIGASKQQLILNGFSPLWSLGVEEQFYLFWPIVVLLVSERTLGRVGVFLLFAAPLLRFVYTGYFRTHFAFYYLTPFRMDSLCAGALLAIVWRHRPYLMAQYRRVAGVIGIAATVLILALSRFSWFHMGSNTHASNTLLISLVLIVSVCALVVALSGKGWLCEILRWAPLRFIGIISYSMYLIHVTMLEETRRYVHQPVAMLVIALAATIAYSTITWYAFEKRLLKA